MFIRNLLCGQFRVRAAATMALIRDRYSTAPQYAKTVVPGFLATSVAGLLCLSIHEDPLVPRHHITLSNLMDKVLIVKEFESIREKIMQDGLSPTHPLSIRYMDLGRKVTSGYDKIQWEFCIMNNEDEFKAFCVMTHDKGFICSTLKAVREVRTDGQIASILAHEASHALSRHISEKMAMAIIPAVCIPLVSGLSCFLFPGSSLTVFVAITGVFGIGGLVLSLVYNRANSVKRELQADEMGVLIMASAGFDPHEMIKGLTTMHAFTEDSVEFLPTHPPFKKRVQSLLLSSAYEEARKKYLENGN